MRAASRAPAGWRLKTASGMDANLPDCPVIHVPREIMAAVVRVESARNPYAIGVVGGRLVRQPTNREEALATLRDLESRGYNYSVGIAQVNRSNFQKYGINKANLAFDVCANLEAGSKILQECYSRSKGNWGNAFSCYYSGNFVTGYKHGYVQKVAQAYVAADDAAAVAGADKAAKSLLVKPSVVSPSVRIVDGRLEGGVAIGVEHLASVVPAKDHLVGEVKRASVAAKENNSAADTVTMVRSNATKPETNKLRGTLKASEQNDAFHDVARVF